MELGCKIRAARSHQIVRWSQRRPGAQGNPDPCETHNQQRERSLKEGLISEAGASGLQHPGQRQLRTSWQLPACLAPGSPSAAVPDRPRSWRYRSAGSWRRPGPALSCCRPAAACRPPPASVSQSQASPACRCSSANAKRRRS